VRVEATTGRKNSNLTVRTKKGYYPTQQQQQQQAQAAKTAGQ
jgi:hypothetical protein